MYLSPNPNPMAAYMWNGLQPVTSFTLIPNPNPHPKPNRSNNTAIQAMGGRAGVGLRDVDLV